jgi:hypothetical protein
VAVGVAQRIGGLGGLQPLDAVADLWEGFGQASQRIPRRLRPAGAATLSGSLPMSIVPDSVLAFRLATAISRVAAPLPTASTVSELGRR